MVTGSLSTEKMVVKMTAMYLRSKDGLVSGWNADTGNGRQKIYRYD